MPTSRSSSTTTSTHLAASESMASVLKTQLENSTSSTVYVPLGEGADTPTDDELKALLAEGIHAEVDVVRNALAVRKAGEDEIAAATAPSEPAASEPAHTL